MDRRHFSIYAMTGLLVSSCQRTLTRADEPDWRIHFNELDRGAIYVDLANRRLSFWGSNASSYLEFPIGIPRSDEFTRTGYTWIVRKKANPTWTPTPAMRKRNPSLPSFVPAGPNNPLGRYALYLGWQYYAIHGTDDPVTIGRRSTSGCIRLFDGHIERLFYAAEIGTQIKIK